MPELGDEFWGNTRVRYPAQGKERLTVRFDEVMVQWFRSQGNGVSDQNERCVALVL